MRKKFLVLNNYKYFLHFILKRNQQKYSSPIPKIVLLSNRLPFTLKTVNGKLERVPNAGGLVTAVCPVITQGDGIWVGWPGPNFKSTDKIPEAQPNDKTPTAGLKSKNIVPVTLDHELYNLYYNGCCNHTFWPLFHSMPLRTKYSNKFWNAYEVGNALFANKALEAIKSVPAKDRNNMIVWIHDYHLMVASRTVRQAILNDKIKVAFFLHTPFPVWDLLRLCPWADILLQGMLGCDLIGFHTAHYCKNFISCCHNILNCIVDYDKMLVEISGRTIQVKPLPIAIPYEPFEQMAAKSNKILTHDLKVILGVDRLDYTKGISQRMRIYELFLKMFPKYIEKVVYLQIAVPSRTDVDTYHALKIELDQLVGEINGKYATANWSPIRYIYGMIPQYQLASLYRDSQVGFIVPLRDGMNLVAKEYVACQTASPGVLVISPFAGAAESMKEALVCSPYDSVHAAETLHRALTMSDTEKEIRMRLLRAREKRFDIHYWVDSFLKSMERIHGDSSQMRIEPLTMKDLDNYGKKWNLNPHVAILLDYDGTLAPVATKPELAVLPASTKQKLEQLSKMSNVTLAVISGRVLENVRDMVGLKNVIYSGSHGLTLLYPDGERDDVIVSEEIKSETNKLFKTLKDSIKEPGAWVEHKGVNLTFHYREAAHDKHVQLKENAMKVINSFPRFKAHKAHKAVEAKPILHINKGTTTLKILKKKFGLDWEGRLSVFFVGDDHTDEDAIKVLKGLGHTFRLTPDAVIKTDADRRLPSTESVYTLLEWLEKYYSKLLKEKTK